MPRFKSSNHYSTLKSSNKRHRSSWWNKCELFTPPKRDITQRRLKKHSLDRVNYQSESIKKLNKHQRSRRKFGSQESSRDKESSRSGSSAGKYYKLEERKRSTLDTNCSKEISKRIEYKMGDLENAFNRAEKETSELRYS